MRFIAITAGLVGLSAFSGIGLATAHGLVFEDAGKPSLSELTAANGVQETVALAPDFAKPALPAPETVVLASLTQPDLVAADLFVPNTTDDVIVGTAAFAPVSSPAPRARGDAAPEIVAQNTFLPRPAIQRPTTTASGALTTQTLQPTWLLGVFR